MKKKLIPLLVAGSALIAGCDKPASTPSANGTTPAVTSAVPVAVVDKAAQDKEVFIWHMDCGLHRRSACCDSANGSVLSC